ncbi:hypothetical protein SISNIDRAFT_452661 [Sistotremastrum niveocremeum HHB9708]|uniref:Uncharacterized protein n=1 Tax=Sistotremastrum niveocremeum HHB9708 TaxID=1314777 RepID=A0A164WRL3_9AGAM|nr:hypothetical protein SISNIDRAFT_452661 [Sistotremastrum niveocremeum HHB9708]
MSVISLETAFNRLSSLSHAELLRLATVQHSLLSATYAGRPSSAQNQKFNYASDPTSLPEDIWTSLGSVQPTKASAKGKEPETLKYIAISELEEIVAMKRERIAILQQIIREITERTKQDDTSTPDEDDPELELLHRYNIATEDFDVPIPRKPITYPLALPLLPDKRRRRRAFYHGWLEEKGLRNPYAGEKKRPLRGLSGAERVVDDALQARKRRRLG